MRSVLLEAITSLAPCDAACSATAKPIPEEPPRMTTRLLFKPFPCSTEPSFLWHSFCLHSLRCRGACMRIMHNYYDGHAFRETPPSPFEPSDYVRRDCGGEE